MHLPPGFASALPVALAHSLWQLSLLGILASLCLATLRRATPSLRHIVGMSWLLAMVAAPAVTLVRWQAPSFARGGLLQTLRALPGVEKHITGAIASWLPVPSSLVAELWLLGVTLMVLLHIGGGWAMLRGLERAPFQALPEEWRRRVDAMSAALGITRAVAVRLAAGVSTPFTAGLLRPIVWLPQALLAQLPVDQVRAILAHELAHIRRLDWLWNGLQCGIESLLFFHPAMWWLSRRVRQDREHACDDLAVEVCGDGLALAEGLAALARAGWTAHPVVLAANGGALVQRIRHILSQPPAGGGRIWRGPAFAALLLAAGMLFAMQAEAPLRMSGTLVAFNKALPWPGAMQTGADLPPHRAGTGALPPPPPPPSLYESPEFRALFMSIQADPRLTAMLGAFPAVEPDSLQGDIKMWKDADTVNGERPHRPGGTADFTVALSGAGRRAQVRYAGRLREGIWKTARMEVAPLGAK
jgi:beta-lactamase regulating signal transducer with metallopeptidase domain